MKRSRFILAGVLALGLAGTVAAATAYADEPGVSGVPGASAVPGAACPTAVTGHTTIKVENGKVYLDGKEVGTAPSGEGEKTVVLETKDGKVHVGVEADAPSGVVPPERTEAAPPGSFEKSEVGVDGKGEAGVNEVVEGPPVGTTGPGLPAGGAQLLCSGE